MQEKKRNSGRYVALLMNEMYLQRLENIDLDLGPEIGKLVHLLLLLPPVKFISPVGSQSFHIREWDSEVPACILELVGEFC